MTAWILIAVKFARKYWKQLGVALVAALIMVGVASLYVRAIVAEGQVAKLEAQVEAFEIRDATWAENLSRCIQANQKWKEILEGYSDQLEQLGRSQREYRARLREAQAAHESTRAELVDLEARVTAESCTRAVRELVDALGWGPKITTAGGAVEIELPLYAIQGTPVATVQHGCCDCALQHLVTIQGTRDIFGFPSIRMRWVRLDRETALQRRLKWGPDWDRQDWPGEFSVRNR